MAPPAAPRGTRWGAARSQCSQRHPPAASRSRCPRSLPAARRWRGRSPGGGRGRGHRAGPSRWRRGTPTSPLPSAPPARRSASSGSPAGSRCRLWHKGCWGVTVVRGDPQHPPGSPALTGADDAGVAAAALGTRCPPPAGAEEELGAGALESCVPLRLCSRLEQPGPGHSQHRAAAQLPADDLPSLHVHGILTDTDPGSALTHLQPPRAAAIATNQPGEPCAERLRLTAEGWEQP